MKRPLLALLILALSTPALAHDYRTYDRPHHRTHTYSAYSYDRPSAYRWQGERGYGSRYRPRFQRGWRDGSASGSKSVVPGRRWR